jgi:hypothetical protein
MTAKIHSHRLARLVAVSLTAAALAAPAASARPAPLDQPVVIEPESARIVPSVDDGFDWDSAAIGAGGAGALLLIVSLGGFTYRSRHHGVGALR